MVKRRYHLVKFCAGLLYAFISVNMHISELFQADRIPSVHQVEFKNSTTPYKFLWLPNTCKCNKPKLSFAIVILSTAERFETRNTIRQSWLSPRNSTAALTNRVSAFFLVGQPTSESIWRKLEEEQKMHHDLIVTDFKEVYGGLVIKVNILIQFYLKYCSNAKFLLKLDDDMVVHLDRMLTFSSQSRHGENTVSGIVWDDSRPFRHPNHKWYIPKELFPGDVYPPYCDGPLYLMGREAAQRIVEQARRHNPFPMEDIFYTGIVASAAGVQRLSWYENILKELEFTWNKKIRCGGKSQQPLTFAVSSFRTRVKVFQVFHLLKAYTCRD